MIFIAISIEVFGIVLLYAVWQKPRRHKIANATAWSLIFSALYPWVKTVGLEYGISFFLLLIPFTAWPLVLKDGVQKKHKIKTLQQRTRKTQKKISFSKNMKLSGSIIKFFLAGPIAFMASFVGSTLLSLATARSLGLIDTDQLILNLCLLLLFWCISIVWVVARTDILKSSSSRLILILSGSLWFYGDTHAYF